MRSTRPIIKFRQIFRRHLLHIETSYFIDRPTSFIVRIDFMASNKFKRQAKESETETIYIVYVCIVNEAFRCRCGYVCVYMWVYTFHKIINQTTSHPSSKPVFYTSHTHDVVLYRAIVIAFYTVIFNRTSYSTVSLFQYLRFGPKSSVRGYAERDVTIYEITERAQSIICRVLLNDDVNVWNILGKNRIKRYPCTCKNELWL